MMLPGAPRGVFNKQIGKTWNGLQGVSGGTLWSRLSKHGEVRKEVSGVHHGVDTGRGPEDAVYDANEKAYDTRRRSRVALRGLGRGAGSGYADRGNSTN